MSVSTTTDRESLASGNVARSVSILITKIQNIKRTLRRPAQMMSIVIDFNISRGLPKINNAASGTIYRFQIRRFQSYELQTVQEVGQHSNVSDTSFVVVPKLFGWKLKFGQLSCLCNCVRHKTLRQFQWINNPVMRVATFTRAWPSCKTIPIPSQRDAAIFSLYT